MNDRLIDEFFRRLAMCGPGEFARCAERFREVRTLRGELADQMAYAKRSGGQSLAPSDRWQERDTLELRALYARAGLTGPDIDAAIRKQVYGGGKD
jgi:hypothetical protein